jgi:transcriptional regulator with XRE-family HTH domain
MNNPFSERLKELRNKNCLSQKQMSEYLLMDQSTYSRYENGATTPTSDLIIRVSKHFNVSADWLLKIKDENCR